MRVKICGITNEKDAFAAIEAGADAIGFILYPKSPRYIAPESIWKFSSGFPPFVQRVAVTVNANKEQLDAILEDAEFDAFQLHGDETPEHCSELWPRRLIKALRLQPNTVIDTESFPVDAFLLDTPSSEYGGTGKTFDWGLAREFREKSKKPVILSGGLNPENIAQAIEAVHPYAVDVSSGVELAPGRKDHSKLRDFIQICKTL